MEQPQDLLNANDYSRQLEYANTGQRFANYLVDMITIYALIFLVSLVFIGTVGDSPMVILLVYGIVFGYFFFAEGLMNGKTIGKFVTKTTVVNDDGSPITMGTSVLRGLCRMVPFEAFSAFGGYPWHDKWTKTRVVLDSSLKS